MPRAYVRASPRFDGRTNVGIHGSTHVRTHIKSEVKPYVTADVRTSVRTHAIKDVRTQPRMIPSLFDSCVSAHTRLDARTSVITLCQCTCQPAFVRIVCQYTCPAFFPRASKGGDRRKAIFLLTLTKHLSTNWLCATGLGFRTFKRSNPLVSKWSCKGLLY